MSAGPPISNHRRLSERAENYAREFLSALFMSLRTAQIHEPTNKAYQGALTRLHQAADALFAASGGFEIRIVDDSFYLNGTRLRFDQGSNTAVRTLKEMIEAQSLGGFTVESAPTVQGLVELIALIANRATGGDEQEQALRRLNIGVLGPQRMVDDTAKIDRATFAVHTYAKLILAVRDQVRILTSESSSVRSEVKAVRVVQDLVELFSDRVDLLLRMAANAHGASADELHGANTCLLSVAMGHAIGIHRRDLGDLGFAALFHHLGPYIVGGDGRHHDLQVGAALSRTLAESGAGRGLFARSMILAEQLSSVGSSPRKAHPFSRVLRVASMYSRLVLGYGAGGGSALSPVDALASMRRDASGWLDPSSVDLLINLLRAFPPGVEVVLKSGHYAVVSTPLNVRWDRPLVRVASRPPRTVDLMVESDGVFVDEIVGTQQFLGAAPAIGQATMAPPSSATGVPVRRPPPARGPMSGTSTAIAPPIPAAPTTSVPAGDQQPTVSVPPLLDPMPLPPGPASASTSSVREPSGPRSAVSPVSDLLVPPPPAARPIGGPTGIHKPFSLTASQPAPIPPSSGSTPMAPSPLDRLPLAPGPSAQGELGEPEPIVPSGTGTGSQNATRLAQPGPDRLLGSFLAGKYRIIDKIGEGGMGTVFLASQEPIDRQVAIKVLHHSLTSDDVAVRRFEREARVISRMRHPNTVTIYDFGRTQAGELFLVMEFLEGQTVAQLVRNEGPLPGLRGARIIRQACGSLSEAHEVGIIHRDLKPDNIFLTQFGDQQDFVKVLDFGLVKLADSDSVHRLTQAGKVYGTPRYMAPEQAEGKPIDHRSDIYTLGVVMYEMLMGRPLFVAETMVALLVKHIQSPPPPMAAVRPDLDVDPRLESIVMWALAKKPQDRPQTVKELARELERWEQEAQARLTGTPFANAPFPPPTFTPPPSAAQGWTTSAQTGELGPSLDSMLDDFLQELTPFEEVEADPKKPGGDGGGENR